MSKSKDTLGNFEEFVLLAILLLGREAYGAKIRQKVSEATERSVSVGALYLTLKRLERRGLISSWSGEPTPERGGRAKQYFKVESAGTQALEGVAAARGRLIPVPS